MLLTKIKLVTGQNKLTSGFSLLEVMIALVVIALTLSAFIKVSTLQAKHLSYLEDKTYALWIAEDVTHELQTGKKPWSPTMSDLSGDTKMFQKSFQWHIQFEPSENTSFLRAEITVNLEGSSTVLCRYVSYFFVSPHENSVS